MSALENRARRLAAAILLTVCCALSGCATNNPRDPLEPFNRTVYSFNDALDTVVMKPLAQGYRAVAPQLVRTGVRNFFSNLDDVTVIVNSLLQLKIQQALSDTGRFLVNSTVGLLGFIDVATHLGLEKHNEDFGQTLGYWGVASGPYLVLPFLGPSSVRDGIGRVVDFYTDLVFRIDHIRTRNVLLGVRAVSNREALLDSEKILDAAALDRYTFIRDAYLQRRRNLVYDGNPPPEPEEEMSPAKPRSEQEPAPVSTLVDQYGGLVAAPAGGPAASEPSSSESKAASAGALMPPASTESMPAEAPAPQAHTAIAPAELSGRSQGATPRTGGVPAEVVTPAAAPTVSERTGDVGRNGESRVSAPVVRVWLPGASLR